MKRLIKHFYLISLILILSSLVLISCSDPQMDNPFDPNSNYQTTPLQGELVLTQLTDSEVKLEWQLNSTIVGNYTIKRQVNSGGYEVLTTVNKDTNSYTDTGLLTTNTYHYQVIGANGDVQTEPISNMISTTFAEITNFNISQENLFTGKLVWQHDCSYEEGYIIERREMSSRENPLYKMSGSVDDEVGKRIANKTTNEKTIQKKTLRDKNFREFVQIANLVANTIDYYDDTLLPNHTYEYRIHAHTTLNESSVKLSQKLMEFPSPNNLNLEQNDVHTFTLTWEDIELGEQHYIIERKIDDEVFSIVADNIQPGIEFYTDDINLRNTFENVEYKIYAQYENESSVLSEISSVITFAAVNDLVYIHLNIHTIQLTWYDVNANEDGFNVEKRVASGNWEFLTSVTDTTFIDETANINQDLMYRVQAFNGLNSTDFVETDIIDNTFPAPTDLQITQNNVHTFFITWKDNSEGEEGFSIERKIDTGSYLSLGTNIANDTTFVDDFNIEDQYNTVYYRIKTYYQSEFSDSLTGNYAISFPAPSNLNVEHLSIISIELSWSDNCNGEDGYKIDKKIGTND
jgi:hypothetical protein